MATATEKTMTGMMGWVRLVLPLAIAGLGWYIGQTVGNVNQRLSDIENYNTITKEQLIEHRADYSSWKKEIERRMTSNELRIKDMVTISQFQQKANAHDQRLNRVEDRVNNHAEKE